MVIPITWKKDAAPWKTKLEDGTEVVDLVCGLPQAVMRRDVV
jgi:hypothetical protein